MDGIMPGLPVHHQLPEFTQTQVQTVSFSVVPFYSCLQSFPASGYFEWVSSSHQRTKKYSWLRMGVSAFTSVLPMNTQDWSPLGWTGWISIQSKGLSRVFSNTTVQKHQFFGAQLSLQSKSHIHTRLLEKPELWLCRPLSAKGCLCFLICCPGWS